MHYTQHRIRIFWIPFTNSPSKIGNSELPHGIYDLKLELFNTNTNYLVVSYDEKTDAPLNDQRFEKANEDNSSTLPATSFNVTVPQLTPASDVIYLAGDFNFWDPGPEQAGTDGFAA